MTDKFILTINIMPLSLHLDIPAHFLFPLNALGDL